MKYVREQISYYDQRGLSGVKNGVVVGREEREGGGCEHAIRELKHHWELEARFRV